MENNNGLKIGDRVLRRDNNIIYKYRDGHIVDIRKWDNGQIMAAVNSGGVVWISVRHLLKGRIYAE